MPTLALAKAVLMSPLPSLLASSHSFRWIQSDAVLCPSVHWSPEVHQFPLEWSDGCYTWMLMKARSHCSKLPPLWNGTLHLFWPGALPIVCCPTHSSTEIATCWLLIWIVWLLWPIAFGLFALLVWLSWWDLSYCGLKMSLTIACMLSNTKHFYVSALCFIPIF